jgi:putative nucleotidyltransferase with HDIG domain
MAHILVVDDEKDVREVIQAQLALFKHSADLAESAETAMRMLAVREYDLVVCDLGMPVEREMKLRRAKPDLRREQVGIEFLRTVYPDLRRRTPCMIVTAWADLHFAVEAIRVGACNFLAKPWQLEELRFAVDRALELREDYVLRNNYQSELERRLTEARDELRLTYEGTVSGIAALLEGKDATTRDHSERVADYCALLAAEVGVPPERIPDVRLGALIHDIGKYRIPDAILKKPGPLTPDEWVVMRKHPEYGADFVRRVPFLVGAGEIVANHHEKFDGSGYPRGLAGEDIPLSARIFTVVDAFDAIVSRRPYKEPLPPEWALQEIQRCSGRQFDPVVAAFERILPRILEDGRFDRVGGNGASTEDVPRPAAATPFDARGFVAGVADQRERAHAPNSPR